jgi:hypothetical protein
VISSCKKDTGTGGTTPTNPPTPTTPPITPVVVDNRFPVNLIVDSLTLAYIRTQALTNTEMSAAMESIIMQPAFNNLSKTPLPYLEVSSGNFNDISAQANSCKILALRWLYTYETKPTEAKPYFDKVVSTLLDRKSVV